MKLDAISRQAKQEIISISNDETTDLPPFNKSWIYIYIYITDLPVVHFKNFQIKMEENQSENGTDF